MKKIQILFLMISMSMACMAQSPFKGFFKPVELKTSLKLKSGDAITSTNTWLFRPTVSVDAIKLQYVGGDQIFTTNTLQTLGTGISYQNLIDKNGVAYCQMAVNGLVLYNLDYTGQTPLSLGAAVTIGVFNNLFSGGIGWFKGETKPCILLNISVNLNK